MCVRIDIYVFHNGCTNLHFHQQYRMVSMYIYIYVVCVYIYAHIHIHSICCIKRSEVSQSCLTLCNPTDCSPPSSSVHGDSPGKNTGVGCHALHQDIFPTQRSNPGLPHYRQILYHLSHQGSPKILEWVAYPFSGGFSWHRNRTRVSCIAGRFFTSWATREAPKILPFPSENSSLEAQWPHLPWEESPQLVASAIKETTI